MRLSRVRPEPEIRAEDWVGVDLERFLFLAVRLGNFNLIAHRLLAAKLDLPSAVRDRIERNLEHAAVRERLGLADARDLAATLSARDESVLLLKGGALTRWVYPRPGLRSFSDIDLLVREGAIEPAIAAATALGYRVVHRIEGSVEMMRAFGGVKLALELHTHLVHHHEYPYYRGQLGIDEDDLLSRSERRFLDRVAIGVLGGAEELVYSVIHFFFHHDLAGLKYHSDLSAILTDPNRPADAAAIIAAARRMRAEWAVGLALEVQAALFGDDAVPSDLRRALFPRGIRGWALRKLLPPYSELALREGRVAGHPVKALVAPGLLGPLLLAFRWFFPGRRYLMSWYQLEEFGWRPGYHLRYALAVGLRAIRVRAQRAR